MLLPALLLGVLALWGLSNMFKGRPQMPEVNTENPTMRQGVQEKQGPAAAQPPAAQPPAAPAPQAPQPAAAPERAQPAQPAAALPATKIHFEVGSTKMTPPSMQSVNALENYLKSNPDSVIHIEGFADSTGNSAANENLSKNRALAVKNALVASGIDANRIETSGMGESNPVAPNDNASDRAHNRRAEVTLVH
jgi:outer membrane protein OmpA-like peptidoglycan-associated protein